MRAQVNDAFYEMLKWRKARIALPPEPGGAERVFNSRAHNMALHAMRRTYAATGAGELAYFQAVQYYLLALVAGTAGIAAGAVPAAAWWLRRGRL